MNEPKQIKQVIVMRNDLGMRKGKMIAQGAHAAMAFITRRFQFTSLNRMGFTAKATMRNVEKGWLDHSFAKVCVRVNSLEELMEIKEKAEAADLEVHLITDSGKTEFHGEPTETCLAIGPDFAEKIDPITGDLKLL